MRTSTKMKHIISQLAAKHGVDILKPGAFLKLTQEAYIPLVIDNTGCNCIRVFHLTSKVNYTLFDPLIVFWIAPTGDWVPAEVTQLGFGHWAYLKLDEDGTRVVAINVKWQASLASFANTWAQNIIDQKWLSQSAKSPELFFLGDLHFTIGAKGALEQANLTPQTLLDRHVVGDWGDLDPFDKGQNVRALKDEGRLFSRYVLSTGVGLYVITEADRSVTTLLLPEEY